MTTTATVTGINVTSGPIGGGTSVIVSGTNLTGASVVFFGTFGANVTSATATTAQAVTPGVPADAGKVAVTVNVPTGTTPVNPAVTFTFEAPATPQITGPVSGSGSIAGGTPLTITGTDLAGAQAVLFDAVGATLTSVTDTQIALVTPAQADAGSVNVEVNFPTGNVAAGSFDYFVPPPVNVTFVVRNYTGVPDELVFVKFLGAPIVVTTLAQTYGPGTALSTGTDTSSTSYNLAEMLAPLAGAPTINGPVSQFAINNFSGGRIYFSLGAPLETTTIPAAHDPNSSDFNTVYGFVEPSVFPTSIEGNTNFDASYVDFIGIPVDLAIRNCADNSIVTPPENNPITTPAGKTVFDALTADPNVPAATAVAASTRAGSDAGHVISITGTARILSPSSYQPDLIAGAQSYHGWTGPGSLLAALQGANTVLSVASYWTGAESHGVPASTLFGFAGSKKVTFNAMWSVKQDYTLTATVVSDLNPDGANPRIPQLAGFPGVIMTGTGTVVGAFSIYLLSSDLDAQTGIYGANPPYVVDWIDATGGAAGTGNTPTAYPIPSIENDLAGRAVGDLLAGFNFGWAACATTVAEQAASNGLAANLSGTVFDVTNGARRDTAIGALSTGEFFYLLSLQPTTADLAKWFGAAIQPDNANYYNNYSSDFQALTNCYNMAFTDRLQGPTDPDMFFTGSGTTYAEITLQRGAYNVTIGTV